MRRLWHPDRILFVSAILIFVLCSAIWFTARLRPALEIGEWSSVLAVMAAVWGLLRGRMRITTSALVHLIWLQRVYPDVAELSALLADPKRHITWDDAYAAERACAWKGRSMCGEPNLKSKQRWFRP